MPSITVTDPLGQSAAGKVDLSQPSSLLNYARAELLHLIVAPGFVALEQTPLSHAAPHPIQFQAKLGNAFPIGHTRPAITLTPDLEAVLHASATSAGLQMQGSLHAGRSA